jgi:hypothetical protein
MNKKPFYEFTAYLRYEKPKSMFPKPYFFGVPRRCPITAARDT